MEIWFVDATTYSMDIEPELKALKLAYFRIKTYVRKRKIGSHVHPQERTFSLGLLRIATIVKANGVHVRYMHLRDFEKNFYEACEQSAAIPSAIAFSAVCPTVPLCEAVAVRLRAAGAATRFIIGGSQINVAKRFTQEKFPGFDDYIDGFELEGVSKILHRSVVDLILPEEYADYSILPLPLSAYAINALSVLGCSSTCEYCQDRFMPQFRGSPALELKRFKSLLLPRTPIHFVDSSLGYNVKGLVSTCEAIEKVHHSFLLSCEVRIEEITTDTILHLERAGFVEVRIGIQSASAKVLKQNRRRPDIFYIVDKLELIRKTSNLYVSVYILSGLPGSTLETNFQTRCFVEMLLLEHLVDEVKNCIYVPYPIDGIDYSSQGIRIINENWLAYDRQSYPVFNLPQLTADEIWSDFILMTRTIVDAWGEAHGLSNVAGLSEDVYPEYVLSDYKLRD
jgi:hypothetical protein